MTSASMRCGLVDECLAGVSCADQAGLDTEVCASSLDAGALEERAAVGFLVG